MGEIIVPSRRGFLGGIIGIIASPAIVKATSLMPISVLEPEILYPIREVSLGFPSLSEIVTTTLRNRTKFLAEHFERRNALLLYLQDQT